MLQPLDAAIGRGVDSVALFSSRWAMRNRVSLIRVDLPEPETPVTQVITPMGRSRLTLRRLLPLALSISATCR